MPEILALIHEAVNDKKEKYFCYDILFRLTPEEEKKYRKCLKLLTEINRNAPIPIYDITLLDVEPPEYRWYGCPRSQKYLSEGWSLLCSGDTDHSKTFLKWGMKLKGKDDLQGLVKYLKRKFKPSKIILVKMGENHKLVEEEIKSVFHSKETA